MHFVNIDTGTTNTRIYVWKDRAIVAEASRPVGVRDTAITGSKEALTGAVREAIHEALAKAGLTTSSDVTFVASGMITSNVGLFELPHLVAPAGIAEFAAGMVKADLPQVVDRPIWFIPGVRNTNKPVTPENCEAMDIMRGEETEAIGVINRLNISGPAIVVLPGSHSKFVKINHDRKIDGCITTISGEMLDVITQNTILASSLDHKFSEEIEERILIQGAQSCRDVGLARSCFLVRILDVFSEMTLNQKANFLLGAVLYSDILALKNSKALRIDENVSIIVCGNIILKRSILSLLRNDPFFKGKIEAIDDDLKSLSGLGAYEIAQFRDIF